jgi:hypothetical protein
MRATRELILAGSTPTPFIVKGLGGAEVLLRQLGPIQAGEIQAAKAGGIKASTAVITAATGKRETGLARPRAATAGDQKIDLDMAALVAGARRAQVLATHYGLVEPVLSLEEIEGLNASIVQEIGEEVMARSGVGGDRPAELAAFLGQPGGPDDPGAPAGGDPAGLDAG